MKIYLFILLAAIAFVACSDDDYTQFLGLWTLFGEN